MFTIVKVGHRLAWAAYGIQSAYKYFLVIAPAGASAVLLPPVRANIFFGRGYDLENFQCINFFWIIENYGSPGLCCTNPTWLHVMFAKGHGEMLLL